MPSNERRLLRFGDETRPAWVSTPGERIEVPIDLQTGGELEMVLGVPDDNPVATRFRVTWNDRGEEDRELLDRRVSASRGGEWIPVEIPLPAAGAGELVFESSATSMETLAIWGSPVLTPETLEMDRPNVILVLLDTLRADHLGCYGYDLPTSPHLDELAKRGTRFERATAQASWTLPATMSILTSLTPTAHQMVSPDRSLHASITTLASCFARAGYRTGAFTEGGMVDAEFGFARGFESYRSDNSGDARRTFEAARKWLKDQGEQPSFLAIHTYQAHAPYQPPAKHLEALAQGETFDDVHPRLKAGFSHGKLFQGMLANESGGLSTPLAAEDLDYVVRLYDAEIRFADECLGELMADLEESDRLDDTVVLVTSDHGEDFYDHFGFAMHAHSLFDELLHVPMLLAGPGVEAGHTVATPVAQIDVAPTLLDLAGLEVPRDFMGQSLAPAARGEPIVSHPIPSERPPHMMSVTTRNLKLIETEEGYPEFARERMDLQVRLASEYLGLDVTPYFEELQGVPDDEMLFDLTRDPGERHNLAAEREAVTEELSEAIEQYRILGEQRAPSEVETIQVSEALEDRLRRLGYLEGR